MNEHLRGLDIEHRFVALLLGVWEPDSRRLRLADSGVPQPMVFRDGRLREVDVLGVPLGRLEDLTYAEDLVALRPGDLVVMVSDGVEDCVDPTGRPFGREGVERTLRGLAGKPASEIAAALAAASAEHSLGSEGELDDRTIVVLRAK